VDVVCVPVRRNEVSERLYPSAYDCDECQEHQRECHAQRAFMRRVVFVQFLVFRAPEDAIIQAEHIECGHARDNGHDPAHSRAELEAGCQNFIFREEA